MMRRLVLTAGATLLALTPVQVVAQRGWQPATCDLSTGHYLVNSGVLYLRNASTTRFPDQRQRDMRDANRVLHQALEQGREDDPAVWYYLARFYVMGTDLLGADSAFDRTLSLAPQCAADIREFRRQLWVPALNRGVDALQNADNAAAKEALGIANQIYDLEPPGFYYLAQIFATEGTVDSAILYYRRTIAIAGDSMNAESEQSQNILKNSTFNTARLFHRQLAYDSAAAWYQRYRGIDPSDPQALTGLAEVLGAAGRNADAQALYDTVLARAHDLPALDVFATGVALFRGDRFERAARAFELGLVKNPYYRDALFNLANTYLSVASDSVTAETRKRELGAMMQPVLERLLQADPANTASMRLLAASFQLRGMQDSTLAVLQRAADLSFDVTVSMFQPVAGGAWELRGLVTNASDAAVQVPAFTFEFLSEAGEVVATQVVDAQMLDVAAPFGFQVRGESIAAWRYRLGS